MTIEEMKAKAADLKAEVARLDQLAAEIFKRFNNGKPFIYNGRRFDCMGPNFRVGFACLVVTSLNH